MTVIFYALYAYILVLLILYVLVILVLCFATDFTIYTRGDSNIILFKHRIHLVLKKKQSPVLETPFNHCSILCHDNAYTFEHLENNVQKWLPTYPCVINLSNNVGAIK